MGLTKRWSEPPPGEHRHLAKPGHFRSNQPGNLCGRIYGRKPATFSNHERFQLGSAFDRGGSHSDRLCQR